MKSNSVTILGAGVVGLSCAKMFLDRGWRVSLIYADCLNETVSWKAGAFWYPFLVQPKERSSEWALASYVYFLQLAKTNEIAGLSSKRLRVYFPERPDSEAWWKRVDGLELISHGLPDGYGFAIEFDSWLIDMPIYLKSLFDNCVNRCSSVSQRLVSNLDEVEDSPLIVNCSGHGAKTLMGDENCFEIEGKMLAYESPKTETKLQFCPNDIDHPKYIVPRSNCLLVGGTAVVNGVGDVDEREIAASANRVFGVSLPEFPLSVYVGMRPARSEVRIELQQLQRERAVVHCYGFGGAGVTLSWGAASVCFNLANNFAQT
jgi:D-amino-acid oxidase